MLNETWLKPSINSTEILPGNSYKVFRIDRSLETHPPDLEDPKKFKKSGGGVLIAVKNSLKLHPKLITSTAKAEIISIELTLPNKKRLTVSTLYRVGTLGNFNAKEVATHFTKIFNSKKYKCNFIVGDMNLDTVNWLSNSTSNRVHTSFINLFDDLGLSNLFMKPLIKVEKSLTYYYVIAQILSETSMLKSLELLLAQVILQLPY